MAEMTLKKKRPKNLDLKTVLLPQPGGLSTILRLVRCFFSSGCRYPR